MDQRTIEEVWDEWIAPYRDKIPFAEFIQKIQAIVRNESYSGWITEPSESITLEDIRTYATFLDPEKRFIDRDRFIRIYMIINWADDMNEGFRNKVVYKSYDDGRISEVIDILCKISNHPQYVPKYHPVLKLHERYIIHPTTSSQYLFMIQHPKGKIGIRYGIHFDDRGYDDVRFYVDQRIYGLTVEELLENLFPCKRQKSDRAVKVQYAFDRARQDVSLRFQDGTVIRTNKTLLSMISEYFSGLFVHEDRDTYFIQEDGKVFEWLLIMDYDLLSHGPELQYELILLANKYLFNVDLEAWLDQYPIEEVENPDEVIHSFLEVFERYVDSIASWIPETAKREDYSALTEEDLSLLRISRNYCAHF